MFKTNINFNNKNFDFYTHNPDHDIVISKSIHDTNCWEPRITDIILSSMKLDGIFIDIGANIGWHTKVVQEHGFKTISVEPEPLNFELLVKNCQKHDCELYNIALGDEKSTAFIQKNPTNYGDCYITDTGEKTVDIIKLDDIIAESIIKNINVIKIDVQGYESKVITGAKKVLNKSNPGTVLIIELTPDWISKNELKTILDIVKKCKKYYAVPYWDPSQTLSFDQAYKHCAINKGSNLFFDLILET
jgi:FkbM family methyltransferase